MKNELEKIPALLSKTDKNRKIVCRRTCQICSGSAEG